MATSIGLRHPFVSAKVDGADVTKVRPIDWNANHVIDNAVITLAMLANVSATQRVIGRNTAGAGVPEEVTASQLFDWVSNTNGVLLTRTAGSWAAVANVTTDSGDLVHAENASPVTPSAGAKVIGSNSGGRVNLAVVNPDGQKLLMQPEFGKIDWGSYSFGGNTGVVTNSVRGDLQGTSTPVNITTTNQHSSRRRCTYVSAAGAGSIAGIRSAITYIVRGNAAGMGGFHLVQTFGWADAVATANMICGISNTNGSLGDVDPATLINTIGVGCTSGDTVLQLYASGAVAQAKVSLGANFPVNTNAVEIYELTLYAPANASFVKWQVIRANTGDVAFGTISAGANLPASTTLLTNQLQRSNGGTAAAVTVTSFSLFYHRPG